MRRILLLTSALLFTALAGYAHGTPTTVYIDPTCSNNGDGTTTTCAASAGTAGPKNTWVGLTWTAGNTYAGKGGTSQAVVSFQVGGSGTAGNVITLTSYGTGQFKFTSTTTYAVATASRSYVTFDNVLFESTATNCLYLTGIGSHITVIRSNFSVCGTVSGTQAGIAIEGSSNTADLDNISITYNVFANPVGWAVHLNDVNIGNSSVWDSIDISNNTIYNVGSGGNTGAIKLAITTGSTATFTNLTIKNNNITLVGDEDSNPVHQIQVIRTTNGSSHEDRFLGVTITGNNISHGGGGIYVNHLGILAGVPNTISSNIISDINATSGIITFYSDTVLIEKNIIDNVRTYAAVSYFDGSGIDVDLGNANITVRANQISNCIGNATQPTNSGAGIETFASNNSTFVGNILVGNKMGIFIGDESAGSPGPNVFANNTILNSTVSGIHQVLTSNQVHIIRNNLIAGSAAYGINNLDESDATLTTNLLYNNTLGNYNSQTAGASDLTSDPLLVNTYVLSTGSPAYRAGTAWSGCVDYLSGACQVPPNIGAWQGSANSQAPSRSQATRSPATRSQAPGRTQR